MSAVAAVTALEIINASLGVIKLLRSMQVDVSKLIEMQAAAERYGRKLSIEELEELAADAQDEINRLERMP